MTRLMVVILSIKNKDNNEITNDFNTTTSMKLIVSNDKNHSLEVIIVTAINALTV